ncbi:hypothetical protein [Phormidium nigroviride]
MKVNYQERIDLSVGELKVILSQQRTITNRQKIQALYWLKAGLSPSLTQELSWGIYENLEGLKEKVCAFLGELSTEEIASIAGWDYILSALATVA